jgi:hypothetical protein
MATAIDGMYAALKDKNGVYVPQVAEPLDQLEYLMNVDRWYSLAQALLKLSSTDVESYSVSGRSFTKKRLTELQQMERAAYMDVLKFLKRAGDGLIDTRWFEGNRVGIYTS